MLHAACVRVYTCVCVCVCVHVCVCMCVCLCLCMCVYGICLNIHIKFTSGLKPGKVTDLHIGPGRLCQHN